jgi:hypothetical protein
MGDYQKEWQAYKRLEVWFGLLWFFFIPVSLSALFASVWIFGKASNIPIFAGGAVGFAWLGLFLSFAERLRRWHCPRCHRPFLSRWKGVFTSRCANCGLPKYSK